MSAGLEETERQGNYSPVNGVEWIRGIQNHKTSEGFPITSECTILYHLGRTDLASAVSDVLAVWPHKNLS